MTTSTRRKFGGLLAVLAVAIVPLLAFAGIPVVTRSSKHVVDTGVTSSSLHLHWTLFLAAAAFVVGIILALYPRRDRAA